MRLLGRVGVCAAVAMTAMACASSTDSSLEPTAIVASAVGTSGLFPTGVDDNGAMLPAGAVDPHYTLSSNDPAFPGPKAFVIRNGSWTADAGTTPSSWISIQPTAAGGANMTYQYTTQFALAGDPSKATLDGEWACDDSCTLTLNGKLVAKRASPAWTSFSSFSVASPSSFVLGGNVLVFSVLNSGGNTGIHVKNLIASAVCTADNQCGDSRFCNTQTGVCAAKLVNGAAIPTVSGHTPPLTGVCATGVGTAVCTSGACDTKDNQCGYADGDGPCTMATAAVCRSGFCSAGGNCVPPGGCFDDAACAPQGGWCFLKSKFCRAKAPNGTPMPIDPSHISPTLDGTCSRAAATLACVSGVCDTNGNVCGYGVGAGPCTPATAGTVCTSRTCSVNGMCEPPGGCNVDGDCTDASKPRCGNAHACEGLPMQPDAGDDGGSDGGAVDEGGAADADTGAPDATVADAGAGDAGGSDARVPDASGATDGGDRPASGDDAASPSDAGHPQEGGREAAAALDAAGAGAPDGARPAASSGCGCVAAGARDVSPARLVVLVGVALVGARLRRRRVKTASG